MESQEIHRIQPLFGPTLREDNAASRGENKNASRGKDTDIPQGPASPAARPGLVLCVGGRGNLDDVAAAILAQLLERRGIAARTVSFTDIAGPGEAAIDIGPAQMISLSYLNPASIAHARYAIRRLRRRTAVPILPGFWSGPRPNSAQSGPAETGRPEAIRADFIATNLAEALDEISRRLPAPSALEIAKSSVPNSA